MKTAYSTLKGIEAMRALKQAQAALWYYGNPLGEGHLVNGAFEF
ncbi:hypothetical protein ACGVWS_14680 [Enterobacteriaceae bacterium LUAb1]